MMHDAQHHLILLIRYLAIFIGGALSSYLIYELVIDVWNMAWVIYPPIILGCLLVVVFLPTTFDKKGYKRNLLELMTVIIFLAVAYPVISVLDHCLHDSPVIKAYSFYWDHGIELWLREDMTFKAINASFGESRSFGK